MTSKQIFYSWRYGMKSLCLNTFLQFISRLIHKNSNGNFEGLSFFNRTNHSKFQLPTSGFIVVGFSLFTFHSTQAQDLQTYINEALIHSPEIQKFKFQYEIANEKVNEANWIPNTEISAGYFVSEPETRVGAQRARISVKQMIPWFGTIEARENYSGSLAEAKYEELEVAKRKLIVAITQSYYNLTVIKAKQEVLEQNILLLETYETLALTSVEIGKASVVSVLRLQIRQNELLQNMNILQEQYLAEQAAFNYLLNRESTISIENLSNWKLPSENEAVREENLKVHPELIQYDRLYESITQSELLNQKESSPMLGFGLDYIPVSERPGLDFRDNGKDILMPMVTLSIPIFNKKYKSQSIQNHLKLQEINSQKEERLNTLQTKLSLALSNRNISRISYNTNIENLKKAKDAEEILLKNFETGTIDFNEVLDLQELQLKFETNQIESVKMYYIQLAIINYLTN